MTYKVDYSIKAQNMDYTVDQINNLVSFFNYCFVEKNSFLVPNFNCSMIHHVYTIYNHIKTNILTPTTTELFHNIDQRNIKLLRYILHNINKELLPEDINGELLDEVLIKLKS